MAVKAVTIQAVDGSGGAVLVTWQPMNGGDVGEWVRLTHLPDKTIQALGATALTFEGLLDPAGTVGPLTDVSQTPLTQALLNVQMAVMKQNPYGFRPNLVTGSNIVCRALCR